MEKLLLQNKMVHISKYFSRRPEGCMSTVKEYLLWRGDLSFGQDSFNDVDALILSLLSYLPFNNILPGIESKEDLSLQLTAKRFLEINQKSAEKAKKLNSTASPSFNLELMNLLEQAAECARFANVRMSKYDENLDFTAGRQFGAVMFGLNTLANEKVIAFRGTDNSVMGWKEDFQLAYLEQIPAQESACKYLERSISLFSGRFTICGHSKGGNLAVYAGTHVNPFQQASIARIINFDGPGFDFSVTSRKSFAKVENKVTNYIPVESMVGLLLDPFGKQTVISSQSWLMNQHNAFNWEVERNGFVPGELSSVAKMIEHTLETWLTDIPIPQREAFLDAFFEILGASEGAAIRLDPQENVKDLKNILVKYSKLDPKTKTMLTQIASALSEQTKKTLTKEIKAKLPKLIS
jgi:hypothetical protein